MLSCLLAKCVTCVQQNKKKECFLILNFKKKSLA